MEIEKDIFEKFDNIICVIDKYIYKLDVIEKNVKQVKYKLTNNIPDATELTFVEAELLIQCDL